MIRELTIEAQNAQTPSFDQYLPEKKNEIFIFVHLDRICYFASK